METLIYRSSTKSFDRKPWKHEEQIMKEAEKVDGGYKLYWTRLWNGSGYADHYYTTIKDRDDHKQFLKSKAPGIKFDDKEIIVPQDKLLYYTVYDKTDNERQCIVIYYDSKEGRIINSIMHAKNSVDAISKISKYRNNVGPVIVLWTDIAEDSLDNHEKAYKQIDKYLKDHRVK